MGLLVLEARVSLVASLKRALVRLLARVSSHVHDQHVLRFERFPFTGTVAPATDETLLVVLNVILFQMLDKFFLCPELATAVLPFAVGLYQIARLFLLVLVVRFARRRRVRRRDRPLLVALVVDGRADDVAGRFPLVAAVVSFGRSGRQVAGRVVGEGGVLAGESGVERRDEGRRAHQVVQRMQDSDCGRNAERRTHGSR